MRKFKQALDDTILKPLGHKIMEDAQKVKMVVEEVVDGTPPDHEEGVKDRVEDGIEVESAPVAPAQKDPSFNCTACNGEGLKDEYTVCPVCQGTGKV